MRTINVEYGYACRYGAPHPVVIGFRKGLYCSVFSFLCSVVQIVVNIFGFSTFDVFEYLYLIFISSRIGNNNIRTTVVSIRYVYLTQTVIHHIHLPRVYKSHNSYDIKEYVDFCNTSLFTNYVKIKDWRINLFKANVQVFSSRNIKKLQAIIDDIKY